jgi:DNA-binding protein H-NS
MATIASIQKQIAKLKKQAEDIRAAALAVASAKAAKLGARHRSITQAAELPAKSGKKSGRIPAVFETRVTPAKSVGAPKYRDPASDKTWTGKGRAPNWIVGAKNRDRFLINAPSKVAAKKVAKRAPEKMPEFAPLVIRKPGVAKRLIALAKPAAKKAGAKKAAAPKR